MRAADAQITVRPGYADDAAALFRLAALDSAVAPPPAPVLLAEVDGEVRAALSLRDGSSIADPFHFTENLLSLLRIRAVGTQSSPRPTRRFSPLSIAPLRHLGVPGS